MLAWIPYRGYWSTPFARWQGDFAHLHALKFAAHVARAELDQRQIDAKDFDFAAYGLTIGQHQSFFGLPWVTAMLGAPHLTGPTISQACATGVRLMATAAGEMATGGARRTLVIGADRTSNGPHVYYPAPEGPGGTGTAENIVMDNFNDDPHARCAMVDTAENVARREGIDTAEQHELVLHRHAQYASALDHGRAFQTRYMAARLDVPDARLRKTIRQIEGDQGVYPTNAEKLATLRPVREGGSVTFAGQTHPADGNAAMILTARAEEARDLAPAGAPPVGVLAFGQGREDKGFMPAAPIRATHRALEQAGIGIGDVSVFKSHNPFAVNDIAFARAFGLDWRTMNNFGSSLIWGHPHAATARRGVIEMIEELEMRGGGIGLFQGCAAGDSAMAVLVRVG
ncbi:MAG: thiolase family protein [Pararhodobacter sp.]|nr:thiolase family protein [Pararhodobacter sp.]